jgi:hypothetical protein
MDLPSWPEEIWSVRESVETKNNNLIYQNLN